MKRWAVQDAKARFSEFLDACLKEGAQVVTRRGTEAAVLLPFDQWQRLAAAGRPNVKEWLLAESPRFDLPKARTKLRHRSPPSFE